MGRPTCGTTCILSTLRVSIMTLNVEYLLIKYCPFPIPTYEQTVVLLILLRISFFWASNLQSKCSRGCLDKLSMRIIRDSRILPHPLTEGAFPWLIELDFPGFGDRSTIPAMFYDLWGTNFCQTITLSLAIVVIPRNGACLYFDNMCIRTYNNHAVA